jgi:sigma-B regulation protein RsbU (phosphoserine phosphatase)
MTKSEPEELLIRATIDAIEKVAIFLETTLENAGVPMMEAARIQLAVEEAVTNVVNHGYQGETGDVSVKCLINDFKIEITITDSGVAFDPTKIPPPDISADIENRKIGGLGVHLIRSVMDEVSYQRLDNKNHLTMIKSLPQ